MKLTKSKIMKIIQEELELYEAPRREGPEGQGPQDRYMTPKDRLKTRDVGSLTFPQTDQGDRAGWDYGDETHRGYDEEMEDLQKRILNLDDINRRYFNIATQIMEEYSEHDENFDSIDARETITNELQGILDGRFEKLQQTLDSFLSGDKETMDENLPAILTAFEDRK